MYQTTIKLVYKYSEARLRLQSCPPAKLPPLGFAGPWRYARSEIDILKSNTGQIQKG